MDECLRCEAVGRIPVNKGTIPVKYHLYEGYICEECREELEEESALYYNEDED